MIFLCLWLIYGNKVHVIISLDYVDDDPSMLVVIGIVYNRIFCIIPETPPLLSHILKKLQRSLIVRCWWSSVVLVATFRLVFRRRLRRVVRLVWNGRTLSLCGVCAKISDNNITSVIALVMRIIRGCSHSPVSINNNINWSNYDLQLVLMEKIDCRGNWAVVSVSRNSRDELACANG